MSLPPNGRLNETGSFRLSEISKSGRAAGAEQTQEQADQIAERSAARSNRQMYEEVADKATHLTLLDFF